MEKIFSNKLLISEFSCVVSGATQNFIKFTLFPGLEVRGNIMLKSKKLFCSRKNINENCKECILRYKCPYSIIFETPLPQDSVIMKKYDEIPHPFSLATVFKGKDLLIRFVFFGNYIDYFPFVFLSLSELSQTKKFEIKSIKNFEDEIMNNGKIKNTFIKKSIADITKEQTHIKTYKIDFITPFRIKYREKLLNPTNFEFHKFIRNLLRRFSLLSYFYGDHTSELEFEKIIEEAKKVLVIESNLKWLELERFSTKTSQTMPIGGIIGDITLSEEVSNFLPFLNFGQYMQVGKNTSFGLGYYIVK